MRGDYSTAARAAVALGVRETGLFAAHRRVALAAIVLKSRWGYADTNG
jgi:hypothetical protein